MDSLDPPHTMHSARIRLQLLLSVVALGVCLIGSVPARAADSVIFKILAVNPSETEPKEVTIKGPLPPEIKPENVLDADGLQVDYDSQSGTYLITGKVTLPPKGSIVKNVIIQDVWVIPADRFDKLNQEVEDILKKLQGTSFLDRGQIMADAIQRRLRELGAHQGAPFVNPEAHISRYRDDLKVLQSIEADLVSLRQLMVMAALEPSAQVAIGGQQTQAGSAGAGLERGSLSILTTWRIIFITLGLLVLVSASFFLIWRRQLNLQLAKEAAIDAKEQHVASGDDLLTSGNGGTPPVAPGAPGPTLPSAGTGQPKTS